MPANANTATRPRTHFGGPSETLISRLNEGRDEPPRGHRLKLGWKFVNGEGPPVTARR